MDINRLLFCVIFVVLCDAQSFTSGRFVYVNPHQMMLPSCPVMCPPIPASTPRQCIISGAVMYFRGSYCRNCNRISPSCPRTILNNAQNDVRNNVPQCLMQCRGISRNVPRQCIIAGTTVMYLGRVCRTCDRMNTTCLGRLVPNIPRCPIACKQIPEGIPKNCTAPGKERFFRGYRCRDCDTLIPSCRKENLKICGESLENCKKVPEGMPEFCVSQNITNSTGTPCLTCPTIKNITGCNFEQCERCSPIHAEIAAECVMGGKIVNVPGRGRCSMCPKIDPTCPELEATLCPSQMGSCIGVPLGTPQRCKDQPVIVSAMGVPCLGCPTLKAEEPKCVADAFNICKGLVCPMITRNTIRCFSKGLFSTKPGQTCNTCPMLHRRRHPICRRIRRMQRH